MKKILLLFLAVIAFVGCSSDDNTNNVLVREELLLTAEKNKIIVGDELVFTAVDSEGKVVDAAFYIEDRQVNNPVKFDRLGVFYVVAKKEGFKDSNVLKVFVHEETVEDTPNDKPIFFTLDGTDIEFEIVMLEVVSEDIVVDGNVVKVDKVVELENGKLANVYELIPAGEQVAAFLTFNVVNETIVKENGVIVDYGKRVLPNKDSEIVFEDFFLIGEHNLDVDKYSLKSFELVFEELVVDKNGVGVGKNGVNGAVDVAFSLTNDANELKFAFNGNVIFKEN